MSAIYEIRPRKDRRGVNLISERLPFGVLWYGEPNATASAIGYAEFNAGSEPAIITVFDESGTAIEARNYAPEERRRANTLGGL